jgi:hypothetical protein
MEPEQHSESGDVDIDDDEHSNCDTHSERIGSFKPYVSIVPASFNSSPPSTPLVTPKSPLSVNISCLSSAKRRKLSALPPWRDALGRGFFSLDDATQLSFDIPPGEEGLYLGLLDSAYRGFSDIIVGSDVAVEGPEVVGDWRVDIEPRRGVVEGDREVLYDKLNSDTAVLNPIATPSKLDPTKM